MRIGSRSSACTAFTVKCDAHCQSSPQNTHATLITASVYTEMNAISKGVSIGIYSEDKKNGVEASTGGSQPYVDLMGRRYVLAFTAITPSSSRVVLYIDLMIYSIHIDCPSPRFWLLQIQGVRKPPLITRWFRSEAHYFFNSRYVPSRHFINAL